MGDFGSLPPLQFTPGTPNPIPSSDISVLVTGFGPFKTNLVNASYLIASSLPPSLIFPKDEDDPDPDPGAHSDRRVSIHVHSTPIPVAYATVRESLPAILDEYAVAHEGRRPDLIIHIGIASPRLYYSVESLAHRDDYNITDIDGRSGYQDGEKRWREMGLPPILKPGPDEEKEKDGAASAPTSPVVSYPPNDRFLQRWKSLAPPDTDIRISHDAGHYLCDFIYYTSLSLAYRAGKDRNVLFLHVPGASEDVDVERGRNVAMALIKTMVTCWIDEKRPSP